MLRDAIGIDPDSPGCQCAFVKLGEGHAQQRKYLVTKEGMESFIRWVKKITVEENHNSVANRILKIPVS